jgi:hypothetical protein
LPLGSTSTLAGPIASDAAATGPLPLGSTSALAWPIAGDASAAGALPLGPASTLAGPIAGDTATAWHVAAAEPLTRAITSDPAARPIATLANETARARAGIAALAGPVGDLAARVGARHVSPTCTRLGAGQSRRCHARSIGGATRRPLWHHAGRTRAARRLARALPVGRAARPGPTGRTRPAHVR